mmetsp:Transcript_12105/g.23265  ORF Transcript_12105/g.23265 Transcript_12105/m.23265 type:complete len:91 (+) Transcript_12105:244-516(+)
MAIGQKSMPQSNLRPRRATTKMCMAREKRGTLECFLKPNIFKTVCEDFRILLKSDMPSRRALTWVSQAMETGRVLFGRISTVSPNQSPAL